MPGPDAPSLTVLRAHRAESDVDLRLPFRFGGVTVRALSECHVAVVVTGERGREAVGVASELLVPKWFDKSPERDDARNVVDLRVAVDDAIAALSGARGSAFELSLLMSEAVGRASRRRGSEALVAGYGPALLDRAVLDALCQLEARSVFEVLHANRVGFAPRRMDGAMEETVDLSTVLASAPRGTVPARHTVGLVDPLRREDIVEDPDDGRPVALEDVVRDFGVDHFKLKVGGDPQGDCERLERIAAVLDGGVDGEYRVTLDGNEQYRDVAGAEELLGRMAASRSLARLRAAIVFLEQPLERSVALEADVARLARHHPVIIDESDDAPEAFPRAWRAGYCGVSSKQCKGLYKSILNRIRVAALHADSGGRSAILSAEDLSCQPGISLQQDLALVEVLGLPHVERNGHHFGAGLADGALGRAFHDGHPGLYDVAGGRVFARVSDGRLRTDSLARPGHACEAAARRAFLAARFPGMEGAA